MPANASLPLNGSGFVSSAPSGYRVARARLRAGATGQIIWQEVSFQGTNDGDNIQRARMFRSVPIIVATRATLRIQVPTMGAF